MKLKPDSVRFLLFVLCIIGIASCSGFDDQLMYNDAQRYHNKKDFKTAIMIYEKLLQKDPHNKVHPDNAIISYDLGVAYLDYGNRRKALEQVQYLKSLKRDDLASQLEKLAQISDAL